MLDDIEHMIKQKLLEDLIEHMGDRGASRLKPDDAMAVQVAAPDKEALEEGLDHAKEALPSIPEGDDKESGSDEDDESRLMSLLDDDDDDDDKPGRR